MDTASAGNYIAAVRWKFARTMPQWPHEYTVRTWRPELATSFDALVRLIREMGEIKPWPRQSPNPRYHLTYHTIGEWQYWTMGAAIEETTLINRACLDAAELDRCE